MASKCRKYIFSIIIALCLFYLMDLFPLIGAEESTQNINDRIAEAKTQLLKMIQKGKKKREFIQHCYLHDKSDVHFIHDCSLKKKKLYVKTISFVLI